MRTIVIWRDNMRVSTIKRKTKETDICLRLSLDGKGQATVNTGIGFFDHMLDLLCVHSLIDLELEIKGDLEVDAHHSVEDVGICLGQALLEAIGEGEGISRYASMLLPMDDALVQIALDISKRPFLSFKADQLKGRCGDFDAELCEEFFRALVNHAKLNLHMKCLDGSNLHHMIEAMFKGFAVCLKQAISIDPRRKGVPSSKGIL